MVCVGNNNEPFIEVIAKISIIEQPDKILVVDILTLNGSTVPLEFFSEYKCYPSINEINSDDQIYYPEATKQAQLDLGIDIFWSHKSASQVKLMDDIDELFYNQLQHRQKSLYECMFQMYSYSQQESINPNDKKTFHDITYYCKTQYDLGNILTAKYLDEFRPKLN